MTALLAFFSKLERLGVGTSRAEGMANDIIWQNILKGGSEILKEKGRNNQERGTEERKRTVRVVMRAMREKISETLHR